MFVNIAMGYGEIDKKVDVFYEKLLAKCTNYAIINFDRRKPSKKCPKSKAKDRAIQYKSVFLSGHWRAFTQKGENAAQDRSCRNGDARVQVERRALADSVRSCKIVTGLSAPLQSADF